MNWMHDAAKIYDAVMVGDIKESDDLPLVPICHTQANAHVEVTLDVDGNFLDARMIPKQEALTILPCTEESGTRAGKQPRPHPLMDKLQYLAPDFRACGGKVTVGFVDDQEQPHRNFMEELSAWCSSPKAHAKVQSVLTYLCGKSLMNDLRKSMGSALFDGGTFRETFASKKEYATGSPMDCFVRWRVEVPGDPESRLWRDKSVQKSWTDYYLSTKQGKGRCYVTGEEVSLGSLHPARLRHGGDKAKLISANDGTGFTFRGRFATDREACGVGFEFTQKAHSALRWLIARQGRNFGDCAYVIWGWEDDGLCSALDPFNDTDQAFADLFGDAEVEISPLDQAEKLAAGRRVTLEALYAQNLMQCMAGYGTKLGDNSRNIHLVAIDSATTGRMSLVLDRAIESSRLLGCLQNWHRDAAWPQNFGLVGSGADRKSRRFVGAPAPMDIAKGAYGQDPNKKLLAATINRILPVVIDGASFPEDLCRACVSRVVRRSGCKPWEWEKALGIACSLYRFTNKQRNYQMELETDRESRDYLWGRLLALAEVTERYSLDKQSGEKRSTNAERLFMRFAEQPYATWPNIELALRPYLNHLASGGENAQGIFRRYNRVADELMAKFMSANLDFTDNSRLGGEFLLGYHCQRRALYTKSDKTSTPANPEGKEQDNE